MNETRVNGEIRSGKNQQLELYKDCHGSLVLAQVNILTVRKSDPILIQQALSLAGGHKF